MTTVLITGSNKGLGYETARQPNCNQVESAADHERHPDRRRSLQH